jgi:hypothetical protein
VAKSLRTKAVRTIEISDIPELVRLVEEVRASGKSRVLRRDKENLAILRPVRSRKKASPQPRPVTRDDPLFRLVGIGQSGIPGGISEKKHEYLLKAYRSTHQ